MIACPFAKRVTAIKSILHQSSRINVKARYSQYWKDTRGVSSSMAEREGYSEWSTEQLIDRVTFLEQQLKKQAAR